MGTDRAAIFFFLSSRQNDRKGHRLALRGGAQYEELPAPLWRLVLSDFALGPCGNFPNQRLNFDGLRPCLKSALVRGPRGIYCVANTAGITPPFTKHPRERTWPASGESA